MSLTCQCPAATALPTLGKDSCAQAFGQVQRIGFMRLDGAGISAPTAKTSWTAAMSETGSDKFVITGFINAPSMEAGAARTFGGGNDTLDGVEEIIGAEVTNFTSVYRNAPQSKIKAMKQLICEAKAGNLGVFFFNGNGQVMSYKTTSGTGTVVTTLHPIPVRSLFVGDLALGMLDSPDGNALNFSLAPDWSDDAVVTDLGFNVNTELD